MSNAAVGNVYDAIISEVINAVRVDFEENGVDDGALDDLKKVRLAQSLCLSLSPPPPSALTALLPCTSPPVACLRSIGQTTSFSPLRHWGAADQMHG
jgi:transcription initiation factor TFIIA large subunit